jgi:integrase
MHVKPKLLRTLKIKKPKGRKETWKIAKVRELLAACDKFGRERLKLYLLLMLNIGMYQNDISELDETEVNWERGVITRPRSKTPDGPIAKYKLWPETFALLQKFRNGDESIKVEKHGEFKTRVLVTNEGRPLIQGNRTDNIQSMYRSLLKKLPGKWQALMHLRKTSANVLGNLGKKKEYRIYCRFFLAQADRGTTDEYYIKVGPKERRHFFQGLRRLRRVFIPKETNGQKIHASTGQAPLEQ